MPAQRTLGARAFGNAPTLSNSRLNGPMPWAAFSSSAAIARTFASSISPRNLRVRWMDSGLTQLTPWKPLSRPVWMDLRSSFTSFGSFMAMKVLISDSLRLDSESLREHGKGRLCGLLFNRLPSAFEDEPLYLSCPAL